ncbi:camp-binding domain-like protein [Mytilinidion resinicola]|uniref:cAMP-dependent protein kinase regulatory subunit n=1 Tax=Mytilinidion resinicola TaxID=574789 RepID=A0A6A6YBI4_9PEZI|nr:camp-binding domain-like protein [Mytilinidion resinicola]KAF2805197.1 camp-binding domain-like protein [Mytilinidion resinicola]
MSEKEPAIDVVLKQSSHVSPKPVLGPTKPDAGAAQKVPTRCFSTQHSRHRGPASLAGGCDRQLDSVGVVVLSPLTARLSLALKLGLAAKGMAETAPQRPPPTAHRPPRHRSAPLCRILGGRPSLSAARRASSRGGQAAVRGAGARRAAPAGGDAAGRAARRGHRAGGERSQRSPRAAVSDPVDCAPWHVKSPAAAPGSPHLPARAPPRRPARRHCVPSQPFPDPSLYSHHRRPQFFACCLLALPCCSVHHYALRIRHCVLCRPSHGSSVIPALLASLANQRQRSAGPPQPLPSHHTSMSLPPDYSNEISALNREILKHSPQDVLQFCANFFQRRLESQRAEFLLSQHHSTQGGGMAESTFPGSNPFGSSPSGGLSTAGMHRLEEEEENDTVASPTAQSFPRSTDAAPSSGESPFGNFGGFQSQANSRAAASKSQPPSSLPMDPQSFPSNYNMNRRTSVSAESLNPTSSLNDNWTPPYHQKTDDQQTRLKQAVSGNFLFSHLDDEQSAQVLGALQEKPIPTKGIKVIQQGDVGDYFYVVEDGHFDIFVNKSGKLEPGPDGLGNKVGSVGPGGSFGELALMYNAPRAATVASTEPSTLWALDRVTFRRILMDSAFQRRRMYEGFLEEVPLLSSLTPYERSKIADALETRKFPAGTTIIKEGDVGESFFILESGSAEVYKRGIDKAVNSYKKGDYFGELALLNDAPRAASVVSNTEVKVATLGKDGFQRLLGPVEGIMRRNDPSKLGTEGVDPLAKGK